MKSYSQVPFEVGFYRSALHFGKKLWVGSFGLVAAKQHLLDGGPRVEWYLDCFWYGTVMKTDIISISTDFFLSEFSFLQGRITGPKGSMCVIA